MPTVIIPSSLAERSGGLRAIPVPGATVGDALAALESKLPRLKGWLLDEQGRLRQHVNVFVDEHRATLADDISERQELFVIQAITGGNHVERELLVGTKKGLFVLRGRGDSTMAAVTRQFPGQTVDYAMFDVGTGRYFASATHGQFGPHLHWTTEPTGDWEQAEGLELPVGDGASIERIWVVESGANAGELWAGVAPAALFHSSDGGSTWALDSALWNHPTRPRWEGGLGGLTLHSICPWPGEPDRLTVAMSAVGVWQTHDGGFSWNRFASGLVPRYLPAEAHAETLMHCVHKLVQSPSEPETFYMQFHGGVYRSDDAGRSWIDIGGVGQDSGLPADFGFPIVAHPRDANRAYVIPLNADVDRVTPEGKMRVYETRDRGTSWNALTAGLPQEDAYLTVLRQGFCHDGARPLGLFFGTGSGSVFGSIDGGATWTLLAEHLPPIVSVRPGKLSTV